MRLCKYAGCGRKTEAKDLSRCRTCRRADKGRVSVIRPGGPRILLLDIETAPNLVYTWGLFKQNIGVNQIVSPTRMLCFAAKWLGEPNVMFFSEQDGAVNMVDNAHTLLDQADILVHWNGQAFDAKHLNREFLEHGLLPPSPFRQVDLLLASRRQFKFPSNKLAYVSQALGLSGKEATGGFELWTGCMAGDPEAWATMQTYNERDVTLLEELYEILLPWIPNVPNRHLYSGGGCPACGNNSVREDGQYRTPLSVFTQYRCGDCGSWLRSSKREHGTTLQSAVLS
jgi:uncharacterized protein